ncbi:MAG: phage Gp37/Gp68 family protein [Cyanobacteria bacterium]|nr:phage Gp37/Gp68 family protein [Cyanobacteriota bacterium]
MATKSQIEWTEMTWNPVTGCTKISQGCKYCYAERMAMRLRAMGVERYENGFEVTLQEDLLEVPLGWVKPRIVFVNSMSDLFHESVPDEYIARIFKVMNQCPQHTFQVLTKRSERVLELSANFSWTDNIWMGVSVENRDVQSRIKHLRSVPAKVRFLSCEPLLGPLDDLPLQGIQWVIVGGESGPGARPMKLEWVESILAQCQFLDIPFFFKQWGGVRKDLTGRILHGKTYDEMPSKTTYSALQNVL